MSDDGESAVVVIALLGNPFSPAYARARDRGPASALGHCSMNVALYGRAATAWTLDEQRVDPAEREERGVRIGGSTMRWDGDALVVDLDERTMPLRRPVRGTIRIHPQAMPGVELGIGDDGAHRWWPIAPLSRIEVDLREPAVRFSGHGYHDANTGDVPLQATFDTWSWSRARADDRALLTYDVTCLSGAQRALAFAVAEDGTLRDLERTWRAPLPATVFRVDRHARVDEGRPARVVQSLEDGPFYARALVATELDGRRVTAMHEMLAAQRLERAWVRFCTGFRMRTLP